MATYKWGKFEKKTAIKNAYFYSDAPSAIELYEGVYNLPDYFKEIYKGKSIHSDEQFEFVYNSTDLKNSRIHTSRDFPRQETIYTSPVIKNGRVIAGKLNLQGRFPLMVQVYDGEIEKVIKPYAEVGYVKGSRLDTVTSTNRNAYPNDGESGGYWYVYEGIANQTPTISGKDEDLGGFKAPFKKVFSVNDPDNNETLNITVKLNSATIRTINNATKGESYEIDIDKRKFDNLALNKTNTIEITVSDSNGASAIRRYTFKKVNTNPVVTVTNSNLGEQNKPFNFSFKAADPDGDDITVKVYVDDVQLQDLGKITPNQSKTVSIGKLDYAKLLNGEHRIKIEATDSFGAKGTGYITFSKKITHCWYNLKKEVDAQPSAIVVNPLTELAKGAKMTVKVSLNAKDKNPTWEVVPEELIGQKYNFKTKTKTADKWCIGVDIRIDRADTPKGMASYFYGFVGAYM